MLLAGLMIVSYEEGILLMYHFTCVLVCFLCTNCHVMGVWCTLNKYVFCFVDIVNNLVHVCMMIDMYLCNSYVHV